MKEDRLLDLMCSLGWKETDRSGGPLFTLAMDDRFLVSLPRFGDTGAARIFYSNSGVGFQAFSDAIQAIAGAQFKFSSVANFSLDDSRAKTETEGWDDLMTSTTNRLKSLAQKMDFQTALEKQVADHTAAWPTFNVHLAALALLQRLDQLQRYHRSLARGSAEGLHTLMTLDAVKKAIGHAQQIARDT